MDIKEFVQKKMRKENIPILFIGSGFTKRYGIINGESPPTWEELLRKIIKTYNTEEFKYELLENEILKKSETDITTALKYQKIALNIEQEFNEAILNKKLIDKETEENVLNEYRELLKLKKDISPMKIYISQFFKKVEFKKDDFLEKEIKLLKNMKKKPLIILTTNYDMLIEKIFDDYKVIRGQELIKNRVTGSIFKIHGCVTSPKDIVITEKDYQKIENRQKVLNARLITFFAEHPVFFLGYSLDDENIQNFMNDVFSSFSLEKEEIKKISEKFVMTTWEKDVREAKVEETYFMKKFSMSLHRVKTDNFSAIYEALEEFPVNVNIRELISLENIFLAAISGDKNNNIKFIYANQYEDNEEKKDVIIGIGTKLYNIYKIEEHYLNSIDYNEKEDIMKVQYKMFIEEILPDFQRRYSRNYIPIFKYYEEYYQEYKSITENVVKVYKKIKKLIDRESNKKITNYDEVYGIDDIISSSFISKSNKNLVIRKKYIDNEIENEDFKNYLIKAARKELNTDVRKGIALYDYKVHFTKEIEIEIQKLLD